MLFFQIMINVNVMETFLSATKISRNSERSIEDKYEAVLIRVDLMKKRAWIRCR